MYIAAIVFAVCATTANAKRWPDPPAWWLHSSEMVCVRYRESKDGLASRNIYEMQGPRASGNYGDYEWLYGAPLRAEQDYLCVARMETLRLPSAVGPIRRVLLMSDLALELAAAQLDDTPQIVVPLTGQIVDLTRPVEVAAGALNDVRDAKRQLDEPRALLEGILRLEAQRQGTRRRCTSASSTRS